MTQRKYPLSASGLLDFEGCPKRYYHTKIAKTHKHPPTESMTHGNEVHKRLEHFVKSSKPLPEHLEHVAPIIDYFRAEGYTLHAEMEMAIDENWQPVGYWDEKGYFWGKIDLVGLRGDEAIIIDYKTGKRKADFTQLKMYAAVLYHVLGLKKVSSFYMWLKTRESDEFVIDGGNIAIIQEEITERINNVRNAEITSDYPARTSPLCAYCPVLNDCEFASYYKARKEHIRKGR